MIVFLYFTKTLFRFILIVSTELRYYFMAQIYHNITELIGNTPIVKLNKLVPEGAADVYVKLEAFNPGSSVKDRIALSMIETAEQEGLIQPGATIVEATSGNTGIGLSWVGAAKGYKVVIVMPETMSVERRKIIQAYGAELVLTPGSEGMKGAIAKAEEIAKERNGWLPLQFNNPANPEVHERTTGAEIIAAFGKKGWMPLSEELAQVVQFLAFLTLSKKSIQIYKFTQLKPMSPLSCPVKNLDHTRFKEFQLVLSQKHWTLKLMTVLSALLLIKRSTLDAVSVDKKAFL